jgi:hypothetical protein
MMMNKRVWMTGKEQAMDYFTLISLYSPGGNTGNPTITSSRIVWAPSWVSYEVIHITADVTHSARANRI